MRALSWPWLLPCSCLENGPTPTCSALQRRQVDTFPRQDFGLLGWTATAIRAGNEVVANGAVTGHQQGNGVLSHGSAHRSGCLRCADLARDPAIGAHLSALDLHH